MAKATSGNRTSEMEEQDQIELAPLVKHFELFNRTEGKSPRTIAWHNMVLRRFRRYCRRMANPPVRAISTRWVCASSLPTRKRRRGGKATTICPRQRPALLP